ncbi:MAG: fumarylacetoacetate hydrolase family protein, partial [Verrucomicrobiota bacterium]
MKLVRYADTAGAVYYAEACDDGTYLKLAGDFPDFQATEEEVTPQKILAPVQPPAIYCIGLNYKAHAEEQGSKLPQRPIIFMKAPSALQHPGGPIVLPRQLRSDKVDYECELAVVIGKRGKNIPAEAALDYVYGYTAANDVSARDWQMEWGGRQWVRGKTFDTFCPLGPVIMTLDAFPDPHAVGLRTFLNGETMQDSNTSDLIFSVPELIAFVSGSTTLEPGTVILTGT